MNKEKKTDRKKEEKERGKNRKEESGQETNMHDQIDLSKYAFSYI